MPEISRKDIALIKKVFFLSMMNGYVGNPHKTRSTQLPGCVIITFKHEEAGHHFVVTDSYWVRKSSDHSSGITVISCDGEPIWSMTYGGYYPKHVIPFLKSALEFAYSRNEFIGGRGRRNWEQKTLAENPLGLAYRNIVRENCFDRFSGEEFIYDYVSNRILGRHYYQGNLMLP